MPKSKKAVGVIDLTDSLTDNIDKIASAASESNPATTKGIFEAVKSVLNTVLGNEFIDDEATESVLIGLAMDFDLKTINAQHDINGAEDDPDEDEEGCEDEDLEDDDE